MQLITFSALMILVSSALAADCFGNKVSGLSNWAEAYWDARQKMCGNEDCAYQQQCTTYSSKSTGSGTVSVSLTRKYTGSKKGFPDCWDATDNRDIINQCVNNESKLSGDWTYNGQLYQFSGSGP
ncbi:hypothetical protein BGZ63DRAFT_447760 [Mariannaea sp. PMI_226]|nr:hypothetical protein BGZ63DRAFT_447760 [Mariannaea sp. PMI_226]